MEINNQEIFVFPEKINNIPLKNKLNLSSNFSINNLFLNKIDKNINNDFISEFEVSDNWKKYNSESYDRGLLREVKHISNGKILPIMEVKAVGTYRHNIATYHIENDLFFYTLILQEIVIKPYYDDSIYKYSNNDKFWMDSIIFNPNSSLIKNCYIKDYEPKSKKPEMNVSYTCDITDEIASAFKKLKPGFSASVSSSYEAGIDSPTICDKTNLAKGEGKIIFEYIQNNENLDYSTGESFQTNLQIYRVPKKNIEAKPKISLYYDINEINLWQNKKCSNWFNTWYTKYPEHGDSITYNFKTPKYIMENE